MSIYGNNLSFLNEIASIKDDIFLISIDGPGETNRNFFEKPYFKVYDSNSYKKATKIARIYFDEAKYVKDHIGKPEWILNSQERKLLVQILNQNNNWEKLNNDLQKIANTKGIICKYYNQPNYLELRR